MLFVWQSINLFRDEVGTSKRLTGQKQFKMNTDAGSFIQGCTCFLISLKTAVRKLLSKKTISMHCAGNDLTEVTI